MATGNMFHSAPASACVCENLNPHDECDLVSDDRSDLEQAAQEYLDATRALKTADQELDDATAQLEACQRAADAAARRAQEKSIALARHARR